jgi:FIMAH domain-containing protein
MIGKSLSSRVLTLSRTAASRMRWSRGHKILLLAILGVALVSSARADQLTFSFTDPIGDQTGAIDVTKMTVLFDNSTGQYAIALRATVAHPFVGVFRVNINLFNPGTDPSHCLLQDVVNDFNLATATTKLTLSGINSNLLAWDAGDRVATNTLAGLGNPPGSTFFRSSVLNFPSGFLTNEDAIAYGPAGVTTITVFTPQDAMEFLADAVEVLLELGRLTAGQANGLMSKLDAALARLNSGNSAAACNLLEAFVNQVNDFVNTGVLSLREGQNLIYLAGVVQGLMGC